MPTYKYHCKGCDGYFSYFQNMSEPPKNKCEDCGGNIERVITGGTGLIFKGSGFYLTDYSKQKKNDLENNKNKSKIDGTNSKVNKKTKIKSKKVEKNE